VSVYDEPKRRLQAFFYLLLRDNLPAGSVEKIVNIIEVGDDDLVLSNDHVSGYAWELVGKILGEEADLFAVSRLERILNIIEGVEIRCMAADGPVTPTIREMREDEMREIYNLAKENKK